jgi:hypothetical protein
MRKNVWDPSEGLHELYNFWGFRGLDGLVSSGLGGGSLIYANVLMRKDEELFVKEDVSNRGYEYWSITRAELDPTTTPSRGCCARSGALSIRRLTATRPGPGLSGRRPGGSGWSLS